MDINLILSAQTLRLAPQLKWTEPNRGLIEIKNVPARTYMRVTPEQLAVLKYFEKPQMVPAVLGAVIKDRKCLPLGEFYELVLKALRESILLEPGVGPEPVRAHEWNTTIRPELMSKPLIGLFIVGMGLALVFPPKLPSNGFDIVGGILLASAALSFSDFLAGCMIRGGGGEVYGPRWKWSGIPPHFAINRCDAVMLPQQAQTLVSLAAPAMLATAAGIASWHAAGWAFFPMIGLIWSIRPVFGGHVVPLFHVGVRKPLSDAEQGTLFPPNRHPEVRGQYLRRTLGSPTTWVKLLYGLVWASAALYWSGRFKEFNVWSPNFWQAYGIRIGIGIGGSLVLLGICYAGWEAYQLAKESARNRRNRVNLWIRRWLSRSAAVPDESTRSKALAASPLFSALQPPERRELTRVVTVRRHSPWKLLAESSGVPTKVSLIVSGKVSVRRTLPTGRTVQVQLLSEGDIVGLHDLADPKFPNYSVRTLTPVTLLTMDRSTAEQLVVSKIPPTVLTDMLLKLPFLRRISLCRNWHLQAIKRFSRLSSISAFEPGECILSEGKAVEDFFIIFQGDARVTQGQKQLSVVHSGEFFGEIGLMQNSTPTASVTARNGTRCLSISRIELLRFVTHNYTVALELERVSSERLGRPLFPLKPGDFRGI